MRKIINSYEISTESEHQCISRNACVNLGKAIAVLSCTIIGAPPIESLSTVTRKPNKASTILNFRVGDHDIPHLTSPLDYRYRTEYIPTWLRGQDDSHVTKSFNDLTSALHRSSYFSTSETEFIISSIKRISGDDHKKAAGAAQLCLILVETMDMGIETVLAAAYHFCICCDTRERNAMLQTISSDTNVIHEDWSSMWNVHTNSDIRLNVNFPHVEQIVRETALLKKTEMTAASIVQRSDADMMRSLLLSETSDWRALAIRTAAALYRLRCIIEDLTCRSGYFLSVDERRVAKEAMYIYAPLASQLGMNALKNELENSAFRILYRRQYEKVTVMAEQCRREHSIKDEMKCIVEDMTKELNELLRSDRKLMDYADKVKVTSRVKEPYSLWKKMLKTKSKSILDIPDAVALRVVVDARRVESDEDVKVTQARERALCYYVRSLCINRWNPDHSNPRFKDYIKFPKKNGYQSLHYTSNTKWKGDKWQFEIQIRSGEMHRVATYGLAAHWDYKLHGSNKVEKSMQKADHSSDAYLKSVQAWHWQQVGSLEIEETELPHSESNEEMLFCSEKERSNEERLAPFIESLRSTRSDLMRSQVIVFLSPTMESCALHDGRIVCLPAGSCVMDALRKGEEMFGIAPNIHGYGVAQNDHQTEMTERLMNGDVLRIPIDRTVSVPCP